MHQRHEIELIEAITADPARVGVLRRAVAAVVPASLDALVPVLELLVSEVVTNVVLHAGGRGELRVWIDGGAIRVEAWDESARLPVSRQHAVDAVAGRGMGLVEILASEWGVIPGRIGKCVWFELGDHGRRAADPAAVDDAAMADAERRPVPIVAT